jgi:hypothetical protein
MGVKLSAVFPPIVPRIPEIDFINVIVFFFCTELVSVSAEQR